MNPVLFEQNGTQRGLLRYTASLSEFAWKNQLVGQTAEGFLFVDEKIPRSGFYEYIPKLCPGGKSPM